MRGVEREAGGGVADEGGGGRARGGAGENEGGEEEEEEGDDHAHGGAVSGRWVVPPREGSDRPGRKE